VALREHPRRRVAPSECQPLLLSIQTADQQNFREWMSGSKKPRRDETIYLLIIRRVALREHPRRRVAPSECQPLLLSRQRADQQNFREWMSGSKKTRRDEKIAYLGSNLRLARAHLAVSWANSDASCSGEFRQPLLLF
jgi:hypothetical protein